MRNNLLSPKLNGGVYSQKFNPTCICRNKLIANKTQAKTQWRTVCSRADDDDDQFINLLLNKIIAWKFLSDWHKKTLTNKIDENRWKVKNESRINPESIAMKKLYITINIPWSQSLPGIYLLATKRKQFFRNSSNIISYVGNWFCRKPHFRHNLGQLNNSQLYALWHSIHGILYTDQWPAN